MGPIPPDFITAAGAGRVLRMGGRDAESLVAEAGDTPLFVYDMSIVRDRIARLRAALPVGVAIHYAVKANPFPPLLAAIAPLVGKVEAGIPARRRLRRRFRGRARVRAGRGHGRIGDFVRWSGQA